MFFSFALFSFIGRILPVEEAVHAYSFTYLIGFAVATARAFWHLAAKIDGERGRNIRLRQLRQGLSFVLIITPILAIFTAACIYTQTGSLLWAVVALSIVLLCSVDFDMLRGIVDKQPIFPGLLTVGTAISLVVLMMPFPPRLELVLFALAFQWVPVGLQNILLVKRLLRQRVQIKLTAAIFALFLYAAFDGIVLNAPFIGLISLQSDQKFALAQVFRIFVASLPLLPLLMHWSNSPMYAAFCRQRRLSQSALFFWLLLVSGALCGGFFAFFYGFVSGLTVDWLTFSLYILLLLGYSYFSPNMRFNAGVGSNKIIVLTSLLLLYFAILLMISYFVGESQMLAVVAVQFFILVCAGGFLGTSKPLQARRV